MIYHTLLYKEMNETSSPDLDSEKPCGFDRGAFDKTWVQTKPPAHCTSRQSFRLMVRRKFQEDEVTRKKCKHGDATQQRCRKSR